MRWNRRYLFKSYIKGSLWLVPFVAIVLYWIVSHIAFGVDDWLAQSGYIDESSAFYGASMTGARTVLETIITATLSFLVFTFGSLLVAIQVAGGQYTPRIIATVLLRDNPIRFTVGYFVFTMLFSLRLLTKLGNETVPQFNIFIAAVSGIGSVVVFLYLIDHAARLLRPVSIVKRVGEFGIAVIQNLYPELTTGSWAMGSSRRLLSLDRTVTHAGTSGVVLAVDVAGILEQSRLAGGVIEIVPQVGDFVAVDEPIFRLYDCINPIKDNLLRQAVALGSERTLDQDPTFAFRILVDIAIKALSPAINDPTTAVIAIDQLHRLLRMVGLRHVNREEFHDAEGNVRLIFRTPNWEDFVHLTCIEIRHFGVSSIQVMRRMRSMLENLMQTLPQHRHAELSLQLNLLDREIERFYQFEEDRAVARIPDSQGLGGGLGIQAAI